MAWLRRCAALIAAGLVAAAICTSVQTESAQANVACDIGIAPGAAVTGAVGIGNPVGDACEALTDPVLGPPADAAIGPLEDAANAVGQGVFKEITTWASDGAVWLLGEI